MKKLRISLISILVLVTSALMCLFAFSFKNVSAQAADDGIKEDFNLYDGENIFTSTSAVGQTNGVGKFILDARDITLTASAFDGFKIVGWRVTYSEQTAASGNKTEFFQFDGEENKTANLTNKAGVEIPISINFIDADGNGNFEKSEFVITHVFENLVVDAVYDYVYYNLDITDIANLTKIVNADVFETEMTSFGTIYYTSKQVAEKTTFSDAVLKIEDRFLYFGSLNFDGEKYYTTHANTSNNSEVEYSRGAFRLGQNVSINFETNIVGDVNSDTNISVLGVSVQANGEANELVASALTNGFEVSNQTDIPRTESVQVNLDILNDTFGTNTLIFDYKYYYVADLVVNLDGAEADAANKTLAYENVKVKNADFSFEDLGITGKYFVERNNKEFGISCNNKISSIIDGKLFNYYNFESIDGATGNSKIFDSVFENFKINVNYTSVNYYINFEFAILDNGKIVSTPGLFNLPETITLTRGHSAEVLREEMPRNFGYEFYGFANKNYQTNEIETGNLNVEIDLLKPEDKTFLLVYSVVEYGIKINDAFNAKLIDEENEIYALQSLSILVNGNNVKTLTDAELEPSMSIEQGGLNVNDTVTLTYVLNDGFKLEKFKIFDDERTILEELTFVLNTDVLSVAYSKSTKTIDVNLMIDYVLYEFNYYIDASSTESESEIMANITVDVDGSNASRANVEDVYYKDGDVVMDEATADRHLIKISNLKLYDKIKLNATAKEEKFVFVRFTENNWSNLEYSLDGTTYSHTAKIVRDNMQIMVVYSMRSSVLVVSATNDAYTFFDEGVSTIQVSTTSEIEGYAPELKPDMTIDVQAGNLILKLNPDYIKFGYELESYSYTYNAEPQTDFENYTITITIPGNDAVKILTLNFKEINYSIKVSQQGGGKDGESLELPVTISNTNISFNMPTGYYAKNVYFEENLIEPLCQTNDYLFNIFRHSFSIEEMQDWFTTYGQKQEDKVVINMRVEYALHTFTLQVNFEIENAKHGVYDSYFALPSMQLKYGELNELVIEPSENSGSWLFEEIPYGASVIVEFLQELPIGFSVAQGWLISGRVPVYEHSENQIEITNIINNQLLVYSVKYSAYNVVLNYDFTRGNPELLINEVSGEVVTMFDSITVLANAIISDGYILKEIYYFDATDNRISVAENQLRIESFMPQNLKIEDGNFNIYIDYGMVEIVLEHAGNSDKELTYNSAIVNADEFSDYEVFLSDAVGTHLGEKLAADYVFDMNQIIRVVIRLKGIDDYQFAYGVVLSGINVANIQGIGFHLVSDGVYETDIIKIENLLSFLEEREGHNVLQINYAYTILNKQIRLTTNISDENFYREADSDINRFEMTFEGEGASYSHLTYVDATMLYLSNSRFICGFNSVDYNDYFTIYTIKVYLTTNLSSEIPVSQYPYYGISVDRSEIINNPDPSRNVNQITINALFVENLVIKVQVLPKLKLNGAVPSQNEYTFFKVFRCDENGNGIERTLTIGTNDSTCDIAMDQLLLESLIVGYNGEDPIYNVHYTGTHTNVGRYAVSLEFNTSGRFSWLGEIVLPYNIYLEITPLNINIEARDYENVSPKIYDGTNEYSVSNLLNNLYFVGGENLNVRVNSINSQITLVNDKTVLKAQILGVNANANSAGELFGTKYDILVSQLILNPSNAYANNKNFVLVNDSVTLYNCMIIKKRPLLIYNLVANDKLFDGTTQASVNCQDATLSGVLDGDEIGIDLEKLSFEFATSAIGLNKRIVLKSADVLIGPEGKVINYEVKADSIRLTASIYPDRVEAVLQGIGKIVIFNELGKTDPSKVNLIPISTITTSAGEAYVKPTLNVELIEKDSNRYTDIYPAISNNIGANNFAVGYILTFNVNGVKLRINNQLFASFPNVENLLGAYYITGNQTGNIRYSHGGEGIVVDLSQINTQISGFYFIQQRSLLSWWQILLIVLLIAFLFALIIIIIIVIRRKKKKEYEENERI